MNSLSSVIRTLLLSREVSRLSSLRRSTSLFTQGQVADSVYFLEDGLVKLTRTNDDGDRIILAMAGPGELIGEEILASQGVPYQSEAEVIMPATIYKIPKEAYLAALQNNSEFALATIDFLLDRKLTLARKVELLCLHDVEYRILHYLADFTHLIKPQDEAETYHVPITQAELADLIGATRETTSTTLNQLERRGLVKLSRRLLTVPSPTELRKAAERVERPEAAKSA